MQQKYRKWLSAAAALSILLSAGNGLLPQFSVTQTASAAGQLLAFPGAAGAGKYATGGRGGEVYHVTNLNDSGEGSFRDAVSKSGRIVVFDVSGTIELQGNILCQSNITIAGQTAPGGSGITLKNYKMGMSGDNIICRFISSRPGPYASTSSGNDAWGGAKGSDSIIDHCSMGWTTDEQWGLYSANQNYTVQYSVLGPADSWGGHKKGLHGFGIMLGKGYLSFDHNLIIHNVSRNFRGKVEGTQTADFTNNIIYDWGYQTAYGTIGHLNYVNNTLKAGKSTTGGYHWMYVDSTTKPQNFKVYCAGNRLINKDGSLHTISNDNWAGVTVKDSIGITKNDLYSAAPFQTINNGEDVSTAQSCESAAASYDHVISFAGNGITPDQRTAIDRQCAAETQNGTGSCSGTSAYDGSVTDLNKYSIQCGVTYSYPAAVTKKTITDADNDGMDDGWELTRGLNPADPSDYKGDYCGQGYMNIEYYINDLTVGAFPEGVVTLSPEQGTPVDPVSAFETIEAETFSAAEGPRAEENAGCSGGQNVGYIQNGGYVQYRAVDFGDGARSLTASVSGNPAGILLYPDGISGSPAASVSFRGTSGFSDYQKITWNIPEIKGLHTVYLKFTGDDGYLLNLDYFVFGKDAVPVNGRLFRDLRVSDDAFPQDWVPADGAQTGSPIYGDRDFTFTELPERLNGAEQIMTACNAKNVFTDYGSFETAADCSVNILLDQRVEQAGNTPEWLAGYTKTDETAASSNGVTFSVYRKIISADEKILLGTNNMNGNCINYTVLIQAEQQAPAVTTTTAVTEATTTTAVTTAELRWGDADESKDVDVSDAVLICRYAAEDQTAVMSEQGKINADVTHNGKIDAQDAAKILQCIAKLIPADALAQA